MPTGVYIRTEKHSFNKGRKHPNRKRPEPRGLTIINKVCLFCKKDFTTDTKFPKKKYCSMSCSSKSHPEVNLLNLQKRDKEKQRLAVSSRVGEKHPLWIKDRSLVKLDKDRGGPLHKKWSKDVKKRDGYKCLVDNKECSGRLESHHILSWSEHPNLRYDQNNGITLCHYHHPRRKKEEERLIEYFQRLLSLT